MWDLRYTRGWPLDQGLGSLNFGGPKVGRKFLAPSLSDGAVRAEKDRFPAKKWNARQPGSKGLPDLSESSELSSPTPEEEEEESAVQPPAQKMGAVVVEVHSWWTTQLSYASGSECED